MAYFEKFLSHRTDNWNKDAGRSVVQLSASLSVSDTATLTPFAHLLYTFYTFAHTMPEVHHPSHKHPAII